MTQPRLPSAQKTLEKLALGGSTAAIWKRLCRVAHQIPDRISAISRLVCIEAEATALNTDVKTYESNLSYSLGAIQSSLTQLEAASSKREEVSRLYQRYVQEFAPLRVEANERNNQREQVKNMINEYMKEKDLAFKAIISAIMETQPKNTIKAMFENLEKKLNTLAKQINKLNTNEKALQRKLDQLHEETYKTAEAIGVKIPVPLKPSIEPPTLQ